MIRLNFIVEGQTEETFVNQTLRPYLANRLISVSARCVMTSQKRGINHRGGIRRYAQAKRDIELWMKGDQNSDARFTTMFDLYALPKDFPRYEAAARTNNPCERVATLEDALAGDIADVRFIPYVQLHEFEALLLGGVVKRVCSRPSLPGVGRWPSMTPFSWHNGSPPRATA